MSHACAAESAGLCADCQPWAAQTMLGAGKLCQLCVFCGIPLSSILAALTYDCVKRGGCSWVCRRSFYTRGVGPCLLRCTLQTPGAVTALTHKKARRMSPASPGAGMSGRLILKVGQVEQVLASGTAPLSTGNLS